MSKSPLPDRRYYTSKEAGDIRRRTEVALATERSRGQGPPFVKDGRRVLYPVDEFERWLADHLVSVDPSAD